jgi:GTPase SAR1 family protein
MEGTRQSLLDRIMAWVADPQERNDVPRRNMYWFYGSPGIGKTSLAHSICANLHDRGQLAGTFFCRRDDPNLSDPTNILPILIYKLAGSFPAFRAIVANRLRNDLHLTSKSMKHTLFLDFIRKLSRRPKHSLVFVIDALDECGSDQSRSVLLKVLIDAAEHASWLKIIITSRPEVDIQRFFDAPTRYDLGTDQEAKLDLQTFTRSQFSSIASKWHLPASWPEESLFNRVVHHANGLFIFIRTFILALEQCHDPKESLESILQGAAGTGMEGLYKLYSNILKSRLAHSNIDGFRRMIGVLLTTAPNRSLCEETIATLAGVPPYLVNKWVDDFISLLYRDEGANGEIRIRHLSISDFFVSGHCDYQVTLEDAHAQVGIACLETMVKQLRFNICKLEDSRLANAQVNGLPTLIKKNISDVLQYSSFYWSNHLCSTHDNRDQRVLGSLKKFFEGVYPLFWVEVLSLTGMVPIGAPSLRRMISWVKVSMAPPCHSFAFEDDSDAL